MWKVEEAIRSNTERFETSPLVARSGFREYDARWRFPEHINLLGLQCVGAGIGTQLLEAGHRPPRVVVGHDYRSYSSSVKNAVMVGLLSAGCEVHDIGLALTPMAYFAQGALGVESVAMVTASHNENGWTGIKVGATAPLTHGPKEMARLREIVLGGEYAPGAGSYHHHPEVPALYQAHVSRGEPLRRKLRVVVAAGNGTAGIFAPPVLERIGCEVIRLHCDPDWTFPHYNPNPEDLEALEALKAEVVKTGADLGFAFDGDGDRVGVIDERGEEIFSDKVGLLVARDLSRQHPGARFVVDVKSTGLFQTDEVLKKNGATVEYWITGHSYMKRRIHETNSLAGFEKSGHFFFNQPIGAGYDDGIVSAVAICRLMDEPERKLSVLREELPHTWQSPTMAPSCPDERKYEVVKQMTEVYAGLKQRGEPVCGSEIRDLITVNGVRVVLGDGTWGLCRASSNKPTLVIVVESPVSEARMREMFHDLDARLRTIGGVGPYDQKI